MGDKKDYTNLSDHYLSLQETHRIASNLNRIEAERERQNDPTSVSIFMWLLGGILMFPSIIFIAYEMLCATSTVIGFILVLIAAIIALGLDVWYILGCWTLLRG